MSGRSVIRLNSLASSLAGTKGAPAGRCGPGCSYSRAFTNPALGRSFGKLVPTATAEDGTAVLEVSGVTGYPKTTAKTGLCWLRFGMTADSAPPL